MKHPDEKPREMRRSAEEIIQLRMRTLSSIFETMNKQHLPSSTHNHLKFYNGKSKQSSN
ncbi:hypothetical protein [Paenibacillus aquistagni]|uniref:Uncharacterized protein n=1 Tax=Paenibacillus aquistagni TaxID=1852522 RepID=A0A1X7LQU3_9BACL|nr:hypothetical protein [Paenibacillus aquistagni]NMM53254.1 hypothetical protein [Paenibacillus aquistagni]SMG55867.1 hypothetical protein SAMN06295960_4024 [Paenibacillus aquistagni]